LARVGPFRNKCDGKHFFRLPLPPPGGIRCCPPSMVYSNSVTRSTLFPAPSSPNASRLNVLHQELRPIAAFPLHISIWLLAPPSFRRVSPDSRWKPICPRFILCFLFFTEVCSSLPSQTLYFSVPLFLNNSPFSSSSQIPVLRNHALVPGLPLPLLFWPRAIFSRHCPPDLSSFL